MLELSYLHLNFFRYMFLNIWKRKLFIEYLVVTVNHIYNA
jgi:hypothetical protein